MTVLFICRANTGRSQIAETFFNKMAPEGWQAISGGTLVNNKEHKRVMDRPKIEPLLRSMKEASFDIGRNIRKEITPEMVRSADRIVVMAEPETIPDFLRGNSNTEYWDVPDPKEVVYEEMNKVRDVIQEKVLGLIRDIGGNPTLS